MNKLYFYIIIFILIISFASAGYYFLTKSVCGNGKLEVGETSENCCVDVGCYGDQKCENNICNDPICQDCQYLEDHTCVDYECCSDYDCQTSQKCNDYSCEEIQCKDCQEAKDHTCVDYECCSDSNCKQDEICSNTEHICEKLNCNDCQYLEDHICKSYECCSNSDCNEGEKCQDNACVNLNCGNCQYVSGNECLNYNCCINLTCDDSNSSTSDICLYPKSLQSSCTNILGTVCINDSDCNDHKGYTKETCVGDYPKLCQFENITTCSNDDGWCPSPCTYHNDNDCNIITNNCENNMTCLSRSSVDCSYANADRLKTYEPDVLGFIKTQHQNYRILGNPFNKSDECKFEKEIDQTDVQINETAKQLLKNIGMTDTQIDNLLIQKKQDANLELKDKKCDFKTTKLHEMLNKWSNNNFDESYFNLVTCE